MDIAKPKPVIPLYRRYWLPFLAFVLVIVAFVGLRKYYGVSYLLFRDQIITATVEQGELLVSLSAYGQLEPKGVYWIGAETEGQVQEILASPGDHVHKGQVILRLVNPQLSRQLRDLELDFEASQAEVQAAAIEHESQLAALVTDIASAELEYRLAKKEYDAKQELLANGVQIISRLELERVELVAEQRRQHWQVLLQQHDKLQQSNAERMKVEQLRLKQQENALQDMREQVDSLKVRALTEGTLQVLDFELGQRVLPGQLITRIAKTDQLIASVKVPELQVNDIRIGMPATIDTRASIINGRVLRIDPAVQGGTVRVELALLDILPEEARPELNIEATIEIARVNDTLFIKRPVGAREFAEAQLFRLEPEGGFAQQVPVRYGHLSSRQVEVSEGLAPGDEVIVSDTTEMLMHQRIWLK